eukprot:Gb_02752 [translate_table: standard]
MDPSDGLRSSGRPGVEMKGVVSAIDVGVQVEWCPKHELSLPPELIGYNGLFGEFSHLLNSVAHDSPFLPTQQLRYRSLHIFIIRNNGHNAFEIWWVAKAEIVVEAQAWGKFKIQKPRQILEWAPYMAAAGVKFGGAGICVASCMASPKTCPLLIDSAFGPQRHSGGFIGRGLHSMQTSPTDKFSRRLCYES